MPGKRAQLAAGSGVPQYDRVRRLPTGWGQQAAIPRKHDPIYAATIWVAKCAHLRTAGNIPDNDRPCPPSRIKTLPIRWNSDGIGFFDREGASFLAAGNVEQFDGIADDDRQSLAVRGESQEGVAGGAGVDVRSGQRL